MKWNRRPQEQDGTYIFSGIFLVTHKVKEKLTPLEIALIYQDIQQFVKANNGVDFLQMYENDKGERLFFIDQINKEMIDSGEFLEEDNHCTLMFSSEY